MKILIVFIVLLSISCQDEGYNEAHFINGELVAMSRDGTVQYYKDGAEIESSSLSQDEINQLEYNLNLRWDLRITGTKCKGYWFWYKGTLVDSLIWKEE